MPFDCFLPIPCPPTPTFGNHKSDFLNFFLSLFVFEVSLTYNTMLVSVMQHGDLIFPYISWQVDRETVETVADFIFLAPKSLQMVIAAMKLKDTYSLEGKL